MQKSPTKFLEAQAPLQLLRLSWVELTWVELTWVKAPKSFEIVMFSYKFYPTCKRVMYVVMYWYINIINNTYLYNTYLYDIYLYNIYLYNIYI